MNFEQLEEATWIDGETKTIIYRTIQDGGPGSEIWLLEQPDQPGGRLGAGGVHHVAFRVRDVQEELAWRSHLTRSGLRVSNVIDRFWFRSIYFRVTGGILFEIATDGPGFEIDEPLGALGEQLVLPPFLEPNREQIESGLVPIGV
jgi:glyoxalase family protein